MKFTEETVAKITVPAGAKDMQAFDDELPGFGVRVFASGARSYFVKFNVGSQQRRKSLGAVVKGNLKAMRLEASGILARARLGQDVVAEAKEAARPVTTLGGLVPAYLKAREPELREKSHIDISRYLQKHWQPLHDRPIEAITRRDIVPLLDTMATVAADRAKAALSGFYGWAIDRGYTESNPTNDIRARAKNGARERVLSEAELVAVWKASDPATDYGRIVRLLMLTGQRRQEIGSLAWSEIDLEKRQIDLPPERTKNGRPHIVPLSDQALAILRSVHRAADGQGVLFGQTADGFKGWDYAKEQLDARLALNDRVPGEIGNGKPLPPWTIHDLRRSFVTHVGEQLGVLPHVVEAILNHVSGSKGGVAGVYNKATYLAERRQALDMWGQHIEALVAGRQVGKVVTLKRA